MTALAIGRRTAPRKCPEQSGGCQ